MRKSPDTVWHDDLFILEPSYAQPFREFAEQLRTKYELKDRQVEFFARRVFFRNDTDCIAALNISHNTYKDWRYPRTPNRSRNFKLAAVEYDAGRTKVYAKLLQNLAPNAIVRLGEALNATRKGEDGPVPDYFVRLRAAESILKASGLMDPSEIEKDKTQTGFYAALTALIDAKRAEIAMEAKKAPKIDIVEAESVRLLT